MRKRDSALTYIAGVDIGILQQKVCIGEVGGAQSIS